MRKTWQTRIVEAMTRDDNKKLWYSHKMIKTLIAEKENISIKKLPMSISDYLTVLIRNGYAQKAFNPHKGDRSSRKEYIYRLTDKPYKQQQRAAKLANNKLRNDRIDIIKVDLGFDIWVENRKLPKWFRDMMM